MSYGVGIVIVKEDLTKDKIRYSFCDWCISLHVASDPKHCKKQFKTRWYPDFVKETKVTTFEKLKTAPCDIVCIIDAKGNFEVMQGRSPVNGITNEIKKYLAI